MDTTFRMENELRYGLDIFCIYIFSYFDEKRKCRLLDILQKKSENPKTDSERNFFERVHVTILKT